MDTRPEGNQTAATESRYGVWIEDVVIVPLVLVALAVAKLVRATMIVLIRFLDIAFPILLQVARFPLFTLRILGDALTGLLRWIVRFLPVPGEKRDAWREALSQYWQWLRQKVSYKAFEHAVHHAFEAGMAWVFRRCKALTPRQALLVIVGAVVWLPLSFILATATHAVLIAKAATLPAWMQLLHPVATILAKSKLLVLPAYPASWPQAKQDPWLQALFRLYERIASLHVLQKTGFRYRQMERVSARAADALARGADAVGLDHLSDKVLGLINRTAAWFGRAVHAGVMGLGSMLWKAPVVGSILARYDEHYDRVEEQNPATLSDKVGSAYRWWAMKFSVEYYEAKEKEEAAKRAAATEVQATSTS